MALTNGNKITATVASASAVAVAAIGAGAYLGNTAVITEALTAYFAFLGGLVMGHIL